MFSLLKTLATKIPFLGNVVGWAVGNVRIIIEYALVSITMAIGGTALTLWFKTKSLEENAIILQGSLVTEQLINQQQSAAIDAYKEIRERDTKALETVVNSMPLLVSANADRREKLATLEKNNAVVKEALSTPVPSSVNCLYNPSTCDKGSTTGSDRKTSGGAIHPLQKASGN